jgi:Flp pilus assembly protein TadD
MSQPKLYLLLVCFLSVLSVQTVISAQDLTSQQGLYDRFKQYQRQDPNIAYQAAKEYLRLYPNDTTENAQYLRRWVVAYEKVVLSGSAGVVSTAEAKPSSLPADQRFQLGQAHWRVSELAEAEEEFKQAVFLEPGSTKYREAYAEILTKREKWSAAEQQYRVLTTATPDSLTYRKRLADSLAAQKKFALAELEYKKALSLKADNDARSNLLETLLELKKYSEASDLLLRANIPFNEQTLAFLGKIYALDGKWDLSASAYFYAATQKPTNDLISTLIGVTDKANFSLIAEDVLTTTVWTAVLQDVPKEMPYSSEWYWRKPLPFAKDELIAFLSDGSVVLIFTSLRSDADLLGHFYIQKSEWTRNKGVIRIGNNLVGLAGDQRIYFGANQYQYGVDRINDYRRTGYYLTSFVFDASDTRGQLQRWECAGILYLYLEKWAEAELLLRTLIRTYLERSGSYAESTYAAHLGLAVALGRQGRNNDAQKILDKAKHLCGSVTLGCDKVTLIRSHLKELRKLPLDRVFPNGSM